MKRTASSLIVLTSFLVTAGTRAADWPQYNGPEFDRKNSETFVVGDWEKKAPTQVWKIGGTDGFSSFVTGDGKVYTIVKRGEKEVLIALDAATGSESWKLELGPAKYHGGGGAGTKENKGGDGPRSTPVFNGGGIFAYDAHNNLYAANAATGKLIWKHSVLDEFDGKELWNYEFPFRTASAVSPVVFEDVVCVAAGYGIGGGACRVKRNGDTWSAKEIWRDKKVSNIWSTPVCVDGHMYGMFSAKKYGDGPLKCVDIRTGEVKWEEEGFGQGHVSLAGGKLLALTDYGELAVIDPSPSGYKELTRAKVTDGKCWSTPVYANGHLLIRSTTQGQCLKP